MELRFLQNSIRSWSVYSWCRPNDFYFLRKAKTQNLVEFELDWMACFGWSGHIDPTTFHEVCDWKLPSYWHDLKVRDWSCRSNMVVKLRLEMPLDFGGELTAALYDKKSTDVRLLSDRGDRVDAHRVRRVGWPSTCTARPDADERNSTIVSHKLYYF